jgi:hypothetical protein
VVDVPNDLGVPNVLADTQAPDNNFQVDPKVGQAAANVGQATVNFSKALGQLRVSQVEQGVMQQARALTSNYTKLDPADAVAQQQTYMDQLNKIFNDGAGQLGTLDELNIYNETTRTYQDRYFTGAIQDYATTAAKQNRVNINDSAKTNGLDQIASDPTSDASFQLGYNLMMQGAIRNLQETGNAADPSQMTAAVSQVNQEAWITRIQALGANNPAQALTLAQQHQKELGDKFADVVDYLTPKASEASGVAAGNAALAAAGVTAGQSGGTPTAAPTTAGGGGSGTSAPTASADQVWGAILGNESGGNTAAPTSPNGAVGGGQIMPSTFAANAAPGQNINSAADNLEVSRKLVAKYYQQYNGDAARVAVAYFSGPGNVAPAGSPTPWINNYSDKGGVSVSTYVANALGRLQSGSPANAKADAYSTLMDSPAWATMTPQARDAAVRTIDQTLTMRQIADQSTENSRVALNNQAATQYTRQILTAQNNNGVLDPAILNQIINDPRITDPQTLTTLTALARAAVGDTKTLGYGPAYTDMMKRILLPYGDPQKISDPTQILQAVPQQQLTLDGADSLIKTLQDSQSGIDGAGIAEAKASVLAYAKSKLYFGDEVLPGGMQMKDPAGERAYDAQFVPQFEAAYNAWTKAGKDPMSFLSDTAAVDAMINRIRPPAQVAQDRIAALNGLTGDESDQTPGVPQNAPAPPPPAGVASDKWTAVVSDTPGSGANKWSQGAWGQALELLLSDPKKYGPYFDAKFGQDGYSADQIVQQLMAPTVESLGNTAPHGAIR